MRPIHEMLIAAQGRTRFHMPGHKGRLPPIDPALDMTELSGTDDLYAPEGGILQAERLLAKSSHAGASLLLAGGATAGVHAMVLTHLRPGQKLLLRRDAHHCALSACVLAGVEALLVPPGADLEAAARALRPDAVFLTRPDYRGRVEDLPNVEVPVLVDAAHGAHFNWWDAPQSAIRAGAAAAVESAHKTLGALTGAAWLHLRDGGLAPRARQMLRLVASSSPSFLILRSADDARAWMDARGREALLELAALCDAFRREVPCPSLGDPTRLYIKTPGLSGWDAYKHLRALGVELEMADPFGVVAIATVCDRAEDFERLARAFARLPAGNFRPAELPPPAYGEPAISPRAAALARTRRLPLEKAEGAICARSVGAYPPGCAIVAPGERFTRSAIEYLLLLSSLGARLFGAEGGWIEAADKEDARHAL